MNDENILEHVHPIAANHDFLNYGFKQTMDLISGIWILTDRQSRFIYYSKDFAKFAGINNLAEDYLIGKTISQLPGSTAKIELYSLMTDQSVFKSKKISSYVYCLLGQDSEWKIFKIIKYPIFNSKGEVEAILGNYIDQSSDNSLNLAIAIAKKIDSQKFSSNDEGMLIKINDKHIQLESNEAACLFYLSRGVSYKHIAKIQNVSYRSIVYQIQRLMIKFNASTTSDLIVKSVMAGYNSRAPKSISHKPMLIMLTDIPEINQNNAIIAHTNIFNDKPPCIDKKFTQVLDMLPGAWTVIDNKSCFIYYNQAYAKMAGLDNKWPKDYLIGKTGAAIPSKPSRCIKYFWYSDKLVKETKKKVTLLNCLQGENDQWLLLELNKIPIINQDNEVEAILCQYINKVDNHALDLVLSLATQPIISTEISNDDVIIYNLSQISEQVILKPRELECLFYLSRGYSHKEIARNKKVAYRTLSYHIDELKDKFHASTITELVIKAIVSGYIDNLPKNLFREQMVIIVQD